MSTNLQNLLRDALLNNTYDYSVLHDTLKETWTNSYSYLYQLQKSYIEYEEHSFKSGDIDSRYNSIGHLYVNKSFDACFDIPYDFIHVVNREEFKRSRFYNTSFTFNDMVANPKLFHKLPIILIDGKAIWDYKIYANNGPFTIILPYKKNFVISSNRNTSTNDIVYLDHTIQLFIVDNILYERLSLNKSHILNTQNKTIELDTSLMTKSTDNEGIYFISVHLPNNFGENYELGTIIMPCIKDGNKLICKLNQEDFNRIYKYTKNLYVSVIFVNKLHLHEFYTGNNYTTCIDNECNIFILQRDENVPYAMPIPVENLMVIKERDGVISYVKNTDTVELFYPNIYRIKDKDRKDGDKYYIHYFYHYLNSLKYAPLHDFYFEFLKIRYKDTSIEEIIDILFKSIINDELLITKDETDVEDIYLDSLLTKPEYVLKRIGEPITTDDDFLSIFGKFLYYIIYTYKYGEIDFTQRYLLEDENDSKDPIEYKNDILRDWIAEDPNVLRDYVMKQNKLYNQVYHLWTKNIDLQSRLRTSTVPELGEDQGFDLDDECYVFAFNNSNTSSGKLLNIRVFVDGLFVVKMVHYHHIFNDYLYIPKSLITENSYIEIEIFPSYEYAEVINFSSLNDEKEIHLLEPSDSIYPTAQDLFYISPSGHIMETISRTGTVVNESTGENQIIINTKELASIIVDGVKYEESELYDSVLFELTSSYKNGEFPIKTTDSEKPVVFTRLNKFKIKPISEAILNKDIVLCIAKVATGIEIDVKQGGLPYISLAGLNFNYNIDYIRIFKNGRMVPKAKYILSIVQSIPRIEFVDSVIAGDTIYIDITPYQYKEVYYQEEIPEGINVIDLKDYIDKPFDPRYYDIYLNGRRLSLNNVITLSPWKISIVNIKSIYNLQIFEKERDYEYFGDTFKNSYYYSFDDLYNSPVLTDAEKEELVEKIIDGKKDENLTVIPNENTEEKLNFEDNKEYITTLLFYYHYLLPKVFINPDVSQFNKNYVNTEYPFIHDTYYITPSDYARNTEEYERRKEYDTVIALDPDIYVEGTDETIDTVNVYALGHLDDVNESIFDTTFIE